MFLFKFFIFLYILLKFEHDSICYDGLGCFSRLKPFGHTLQRPFALLPQSPEKINVIFRLYNRKLGNKSELLFSNNISKNYDSSIPTKFIIHGFLQNALVDWVIKMKNAILKIEDANVITVDWQGGNQLPYMQAAVNTQVVGSKIAKLINKIVLKTDASLNDFHLIGHSLGAHIAGYAGANLNGIIERISGLDPAGMYFEHTDRLVRLDTTDAQFVDVIHTDGASNVIQGFGLFQSLGHVDFYPNGGYNQPGCEMFSSELYQILLRPKTSLDDFGEFFACSHSAAISFYIDSILNKNCKYLSYECESKSKFDSGECLNCSLKECQQMEYSSSKGCNQMGYWSSPEYDLGTLYLNTLPLSETSYCKQHFIFKLVSNNSLNDTIMSRGHLNINFETDSQPTNISYLLDDRGIMFISGSIEKRLISIGKFLTDQIKNIYISYVKQTGIKLNFTHIELFRGDNQKFFKYCSSGSFLTAENFQKFFKC